MHLNLCLQVFEEMKGTGLVKVNVTKLRWDKILLRNSSSSLVVWYSKPISSRLHRLFNLLPDELYRWDRYWMIIILLFCYILMNISWS